MKNYMAMALAGCLLAGALVGCGSAAGSAQQAAAKPAEDRSGNAITLPDTVETIVSMAPSTTQVLIDLGVSDRLVAMDTYSGYSYADQVPAGIPQFDMMAPDNEALVALHPDIIFTTGMSASGGEDVFAAVKNAGICVADIPSSASLSDIEADIQFIGACVGADKKASDIVKTMEASIQELQKIGAGITDKKTVLYEMTTPTPDFPTIYTCGKGTYIDEMLTVIGAENVTGDIDYAWPAISEEEAVAEDPDVILSGDTYTPDVVNVILNTEGWESVDAVENGAVYAIDGDAISRPNQHVISSMVEMGKLIYPEAFANVKDPFANAQ
ncbi:MAG: ABC transporter substrate-binding protein [Butyrivibrio sp.]|nr:ABC transporter substrate-binding protein [Butyrivibrio sp.]